MSSGLTERQMEAPPCQFLDFQIGRRHRRDKEVWKDVKKLGKKNKFAKLLANHRLLGKSLRLSCAKRVEYFMVPFNVKMHVECIHKHK